MEEKKKEYMKRKLIVKRVSILEKLAKLSGIKLKEFKNKSEIVEKLLDEKYEEMLTSFFDLSRDINKIDFLFCFDKISKKYSDKAEEIKKLENVDDLVLFLWEQEDLQFLEYLISKGKLESRYIRKEFILFPKKFQDIKTIENITNKFVGVYNKKYRWSLNSELLDIDENSISMVFYIERGRDIYREFLFRSEKSNYNPGPLEVVKKYIFLSRLEE